MVGPKTAYPPVAAIDTQILIFALRESYADEAQRQFSFRAKQLLKELIENRTKIVLSIVSVAEYLAGVPEADRAKTGQRLAENYLIAPFNLRAAVIAAGLVPFAKQLVQGDRAILMADTKIVASIKAFPCETLFTFDRENKLSILASNVVSDVRGLPQQLQMFDPTDVARD